MDEFLKVVHEPPNVPSRKKISPIREKTEYTNTVKLCTIL